MTDKKFKNLRRSDLIEIIYEYQKREKNFTEEIEDLKKQLAYRENSENVTAISEAVAQLNKMIDSARKYADLYFEKVNQINNTSENDNINSAAKICEHKCCVSRQKRPYNAFSGGKKVNGKNRKNNRSSIIRTG